MEAAETSYDKETNELLKILIPTNKTVRKNGRK